jgi:ABC-type bacteriocin/lantibiotic exporter with double-glycine peptidase domain
VSTDRGFAFAALRTTLRLAGLGPGAVIPGQRSIAPEVIQTSAMDCGPAALKCLLAGFRIPVSYGRLREACQTSVDGTSIDTVEDVANQLGLAAEQVMVPADYLLLPEARILPAVVVVRDHAGFTHFVVMWSRHGGQVQVMDPAAGRLWPAAERLIEDVYVHEVPVTASAFREWAEGEEFQTAIRARLVRLGLTSKDAAKLAAAALRDRGWRPVAALDAATRVAGHLVRAGEVARGIEAAGIIERLWDAERERRLPGTSGVPGGASPAMAPELALIPQAFWTARPWVSANAGEAEEEEEHIILRGAVAVRIHGVTRRHRRSQDQGSEPAAQETSALPAELAAGLAEPPRSSMAIVADAMLAGGWIPIAAVLLALLAAAGGIALEALLLRGLLDLGTQLHLPIERGAAIAALLSFATILLVFDLAGTAGLLRLGRQLEVRLRAEFLAKLPRVPDRYFHSRLVSDLVERAHRIAVLRAMPTLGGQLLRAVFTLAFTAGALVWLDPRSAPFALAAAAAGAAIPMAFQPWLAERDLRVRSQAGALSRFYLDSLLGLITIRSHGAERAVEREHERILARWTRSTLDLQRSAIVVQGIASAVGFGLTAALIFAFLGRDGAEPASLLLLAFWSLQLPVLGQRIALLLRQLPEHRSVIVRLLEPLGALEEPAGSRDTGEGAPPPAPRASRTGAAVKCESVSVMAGGQVILDRIAIDLPGGTHVALLGASGAGKSTLAGLLLGLHAPTGGHLRVDGAPLAGEQLTALRQETAWIDPQTWLWNQSLLANLIYGARGSIPTSAFAAAEAAADVGLEALMDRLPQGMQTVLGENGGLVSGGEGQRVRLGRAWLRTEARLVVLDEPFRGLDRLLRKDLLQLARRRWKRATLVFATHDVEETLDFDHVIVLAGGEIVEQGRPRSLATSSGSHYASLLAAARAAGAELERAARWRRFQLVDGDLCGERAARDDAADEGQAT